MTLLLTSHIMTSWLWFCILACL